MDGKTAERGRDVADFAAVYGLLPKLNLSYDEFVQLALNAHRVRAHRLVTDSDAVAVGVGSATLPPETLEWTADSPAEAARLKLAALRDRLR